MKTATAATGPTATSAANAESVLNVLDTTKDILAKSKTSTPYAEGEVSEKLSASLADKKMGGHLNNCIDDKGDFPLMIAADPECPIEAMKWFTTPAAHPKHSLEVNRKNNAGETALMRAVSYLDYGDVSSKTAVSDIKDVKSSTAVTASVESTVTVLPPKKLQDNRRRVEFLTTYAGADVWTVTHKGLSVFEIAASAGNLKFIQDFLNTWTPGYFSRNTFPYAKVLHAAVKNNHAAVVDYLLQKNPTAWNDHAEAILQDAMQLPDQTIVNKLLVANIPLNNGEEKTVSTAMQAWNLFKDGKINETQRNNVLNAIKTQMLLRTSKATVYSKNDLAHAIKKNWLDALQDMQMELKENLYKTIEKELFSFVKDANKKKYSIGYQPMDLAAAYATPDVIDFIYQQRTYPGEMPFTHGSDEDRLCPSVPLPILIAMHFQRLNVLKHLMILSSKAGGREFWDESIEQSLLTLPNNPIANRIKAFVLAAIKDRRDEDYRVVATFVDMVDLQDREDLNKILSLQTRILAAIRLLNLNTVKQLVTATDEKMSFSSVKREYYEETFSKFSKDNTIAQRIKNFVMACLDKARGVGEKKVQASAALVDQADLQDYSKVKDRESTWANVSDRDDPFASAAHSNRIYLAEKAKHDQKNSKANTTAATTVTTSTAAASTVTAASTAWPRLFSADGIDSKQSVVNPLVTLSPNTWLQLFSEKAQQNSQQLTLEIFAFTHAMFEYVTKHPDNQVGSSQVHFQLQEMKTFLSQTGSFVSFYQPAALPTPSAPPADNTNASASSASASLPPASTPTLRHGADDLP